MTIAIRHAWLQKHPSPTAGRGEFHWHPPGGDRELRASFVERARGVEAPAVLWELAPGRVAWAQVFGATAPIDGRRYSGLVLSIAEGAGASAAELLETLVVPAAGPWAADAAAPSRGGERERRAPAGSSAAAGEDVAPTVRGRDGSGGTGRGERARASGDAGAAEEVAVIARGLVSGGDAGLVDPARAGLAALVASVERWMPPSVVRASRAGIWRGGSAGVAAADPVAALAATAWRAPRSRAAEAWRLLCELAEARGQTVDEIAAALGAVEGSAVLSVYERAAVGDTGDFVAALHAWGRGRLDSAPDAGTLPMRLADGVALRALAALMAGGDPRGPIAEARWHALLPAGRRAVLLGTLVRRAESLRAYVEVAHA